MSDGDFPNAAAAAHDRAWTTLEEGAARVMDRSRLFTLDDVCDRLGVDPDRVRERAVQIRDDEDGDA